MNKDKVYIIGEVGPNHNGDVNIALKMVEEMAVAGVDAIKFQMCNPYKVYSEDSFKATYQKKNDSAKTAREMSLSFQLSREEHRKVYAKCVECNVDYFCTAFDLDSLKFLDENFNMNYYKIASGEMFSLDILDYISTQHKPIIMSTGMSTYEEIKVTLDLLNRKFPKDITVLHCISNYPAKYEEVNLRNILQLQNLYGCKVGFSDHTIGNECAIAAVAMGASMIEKHVTFNKNAKGPDHKASIEIGELGGLVSQIRHIEVALGTFERQFSEAQMEISRVARKSIVSSRPLKAGHVITENDICFKRPGIGFLPIEIEKVIGHRLLKDMEADRVIMKDFIG